MRRWVARRLRRLAYRLDPWPGYDRPRLGYPTSTTTNSATAHITYKEA